MFKFIKKHKKNLIRAFLGSLVGPACLMEMAIFGIDDLLIWAAVAAAAAGAASAVEGAEGSRRARTAQNIQKEQRNLQAAQERRKVIRQMRFAQSNAEATAENQGVGNSSGAQGGQGSIMTQGNANLAFLDRDQAFATSAGNYMDKASHNQANAGMWSAVSQLAMAGYGLRSDYLSAQPAKNTAKIPQSPNNYGFQFPGAN